MRVYGGNKATIWSLFAIKLGSMANICPCSFIKVGNNTIECSCRIIQQQCVLAFTVNGGE